MYQFEYDTLHHFAGFETEAMAFQVIWLTKSLCCLEHIIFIQLFPNNFPERNSYIFLSVHVKDCVMWLELHGKEDSVMRNVHTFKSSKIPKNLLLTHLAELT